MHSTHRSPLWGTIGNILIIILILTTITTSIYTKYKYEKLKETHYAMINTMNNVIDENKSSIKKLEDENSNLKTKISKLEEENKKIKSDLSKAQKETVAKKQINKNDFKSYMPYTAITNTTSKQWQLQQSATTDENGIRCLYGKPMVAVGTGWGLSVGDIAVIICDNGNSFEVVIGDIKDNKHTDSTNKTTISNNCRCEFIVDFSRLNSAVKSAGSVSALSKYRGYVVNVRKK